MKSSNIRRSIKLLVKYKTIIATTASTCLAVPLIYTIKSKPAQFQFGDHHDHRCILERAISESRDLVQRIKHERGPPGIVVAVSKDGELLWTEGFGYADLENRVPCSPDTVMRIASISEVLTMMMVARLWEQGKLDLDKPVQAYVKDFPEKMVDGKKVTITTRHLITHTSGIRHYTPLTPPPTKDQAPPVHLHNKEPEMYINKPYPSVSEALEIFKDDPLFHEPGTKVLYSTYGWTLAGAVVETVSGVPFLKHMTQLFVDLGLENTYADLNIPIIYNRSRQYEIEKNRVVNAPSVDCSYKLAGGGVLSTATDLVKFGTAMLYSYQYRACRVHGDGSGGKGQGQVGYLGNNIGHSDNMNDGSRGNANKNVGKEGNGVKKDCRSDKMQGNDSKDGGTDKNIKIGRNLNVGNFNNNANKNKIDSILGSSSDIADNDKSKLSEKAVNSPNCACTCGLKPGYLKSETVDKMWQPLIKPHENREGCQGLGWGVLPYKGDYGMCRDEGMYAFHSGGSVGGCSILVVLPSMDRPDTFVHKNGFAKKCDGGLITKNVNSIIDYNDVDMGKYDGDGGNIEYSESRFGGGNYHRMNNNGNEKCKSDIRKDSENAFYGNINLNVGFDNRDNRNNTSSEKCFNLHQCDNVSNIIDISETSNYQNGDQSSHGRICKDTSDGMSCRSIPPKGVVVALIANSPNVDLRKTAVSIGKIFEKL